MAILHFLLLLKFILADQLVDLPWKLPSSGEEWQFYMSFYYESSYWQINWQIYPQQLSIDLCNIDVRPDIGRSTGRPTPQQNCHLVVKNGTFTCLSTVRVHIGRSTGRYIFYISTSGHSCNYDTTWLNISDTTVHHMSF